MKQKTITAKCPNCHDDVVIVFPPNERNLKNVICNNCLKEMPVSSLFVSISDVEIYDSTVETLKHIQQVSDFVWSMIHVIAKRLTSHDASKLQEPEKSMYDKFTPRLRSMPYGSDEYKATLKEMGAALDHHYKVNSHHPEHYPNGINGMSLIDLIEMLADWKAASLRHADGDILKSLEINRVRFGMSDQLFEIFKNTVIEMGWIVKAD